MKTDEALANKVMQIYFRESYIMGDKYRNTQEDLDFIKNNEFKVVVTEKTKNNGYDSDKQRVAELLELNKPYVLESMDVGRSSSTIKLKDFPNMFFNSVNFEFLPLDFDFLKADYDKILKEIELLMGEKERIEKLMFDRADDFVSKFKIWWSNNDEGHHDWMIDTPLLRKHFNETIDYPRRGKTYTLDYLVGEDDFYAFLDNDLESDELTTFLNTFQSMLEEAMVNNIKSFNCDW